MAICQLSSKIIGVWYFWCHFLSSFRLENPSLQIIVRPVLLRMGLKRAGQLKMNFEFSLTLFGIMYSVINENDEFASIC